MTEPRKKNGRPYLRVSIFLCALATLSLSGGASLLNSPLRCESFAQNGTGLIAHLSLSDSAMGRVEKRLASVESKRYRRQLSPAPPSARSELASLCVGARWSSANHDEPGYRAAALSPPTDRAPPAFLL